MERASIVAVLAITLGSVGCCCRRPAATPVAACPAPAPVCNPCAPGGAVSYGYGTPSYSMPTTTYMAPMQ